MFKYHRFQSWLTNICGIFFIFDSIQFTSLVSAISVLAQSIDYYL